MQLHIGRNCHDGRACHCKTEGARVCITHTAHVVDLSGRLKNFVSICEDTV